jgi:orotidine-5'-phosphate decarboxylase
MAANPAPEGVTVADLRQRLVLALDVDDLVAANRLARELRPWFGVAKVGLELFSAAGTDAVVAMIDLGYRVLLDLKLHDIPTTVGRASRVLGAYGVSFLTMHAAGGAAMLRAGVEGLAEGAARAGLAPPLEPPLAVAVTVLTSDTGAPVDVVRERVDAALEAGCGGVVCAAAEVPSVKAQAPGLLTIVPGIRPAGSPRHDQGRVATPADAFDAGADLLVIGRAVTAAPDRRAAAAGLLESLA